MADAYSWSSKQSYKTDYVWHDLTTEDPVHPASGVEYVLKGPELLHLLPVLDFARRLRRHILVLLHLQLPGREQEEDAYRAISRAHDRRKKWSSFDLGQYGVAAARIGTGADAAMQTGEKHGRHRGLEPSPPQQPTTSSEPTRSRRRRRPAGPTRWRRSSRTTPAWPPPRTPSPLGGRKRMRAWHSRA
uniref:SOSEKI DIX-like domain-containing protein n=1 Tax=Aegilops tauschii subsp. strangulata TaxID=200361 RepID=A0A453EL59_AEGTS